MILTDVIEEACSIIELFIDWENTAEDENYNDLLKCARIKLHDISGNWFESDSIIDDAYKEIALYGTVAEYAFINGLYDMWKEYELKYEKAYKITKDLFKEKL